MVHDFTITDIADPLARYRVTDASGRQVPLVQWCDDLTGEVVRVALDGHGMMSADPATGEVVKVRERRPAPLAVVKLRDDEPYQEPYQIRRGGPCR